MVCEEFNALLSLAIAEDLGTNGDVTSLAIFENEINEARLVSKAEGILCGSACFEAAYIRIDPGISIQFHMKDGDTLSPGDVVCTVRGQVRSILSGERIALNFLSFLSGIATETARIVAALPPGSHTVILDTRKTLPGYRRLSKYAVRTGGGMNHRMGLYDMVMIKDNHIDAAGSIARAVEKVRASYGDKYAIEVECRSTLEAEEAIVAGVDRIMLDNMSPEESIKAVALRAGGIEFEASGNMDRDRIKAYADAGLDFISVGRITHSAPTFDFSLQMRKD